MTDEIRRRELLRNTAVVAGGVASGVIPGNFVAAASDQDAIRKTRSYNSEMEYRRLGSTGLWVSAVCLGGHFKRIGELVGQKIGAYAPPSEDEAAIAALRKNRHEVLTRCMEVGINYVDACTWGEGAIYGPALKGRRDKMYLGFSQAPEYCPRKKEYRTADALLKALDENLKRSEVEYFDIWRLTASATGRHTKAEEEQFIEALEKAKKQGKARFGGVSSHSRPWLKRLAETYPKHFQVMLTPYTAKTRELPKDSLFEAVRKHDIGTFGIKPFGSNSLFHGAKSADEKSHRARMTIRYILGNPGITAPIPGLACVEEVDNMALAVKEVRKLSRAEAVELERIGEHMWANLPSRYAWLRNWEYV